MNIYNKKYLDELQEDDEISVGEEGFMRGYIDAFQKD